MNDDTLLLRQINPNWLQNGRVGSVAFRPFPKDDKRLSVYDGDLIEPPDSHIHFTETLGYASKGVMAVTVAECKEVKLPAKPDPKPFPEHAIIDFTSCPSNSQMAKKAKKLKEKAVLRDWLYRAAANQ